MARLRGFGNLLIILIVVGIVIFAGGGYYVLTHSSPSLQQTSRVDLGNGYSTDSSHVYFSEGSVTDIVADASPATFAVLGADGEFSRDATHVWYRPETGKSGAPLEIPGADVATFVVLEAREAKDKNHTYSFDPKGYFLIDSKGGFNSNNNSSVTSSEQVFTVTPVSGPAPLSVTFSHVVATAGAGQVIDFGDGHTSSGPGTCASDSDFCPVEGITHTYTKPGTYIAALQRKTPSLVVGTVTVTVTSGKEDAAAQKIGISSTSGLSVTVTYSGLKTSDGGWATPPTFLHVQNIGWSKPLLEVPLDGSSSGKVTFTLPSDAPIGDYTITPVGIPTSKDAPCPVGDCTTGYGTVNHVVHAEFSLSADGTISVRGSSAPGQ